MLVDAAVIGGGPAGFLAAITCAEQCPQCSVCVLESTARVLHKVAISGGGRCNVTHAEFDARRFAAAYPRGARELLGPLHRFGAEQTVQWFRERGVELKTERDGRVFPESNTSATIVDLLQSEAKRLGVRVRTHAPVTDVRVRAAAAAVAAAAVQQSGAAQRGESTFEVRVARQRRRQEARRQSDDDDDNEEEEALVRARAVLLATGGSMRVAWQWAQRLGHDVVSPVPSLFSFVLGSGGGNDDDGSDDDAALFTPLAGVSVRDAQVSYRRRPRQRADSAQRGAAASAEARTLVSRRGPVLFTHRGISGPAVLALSAFGARDLADARYSLHVHVNWMPHVSDVEQALQQQQQRPQRRRERSAPSKTVAGSAPFSSRDMPRRLWQTLVQRAGIPPTRRWAECSRGELDAVREQLVACRLRVVGRSPFKEEFVTAGGVSLRGIDTRTGESRAVPRLYFAGEMLDVDAITGGFNLQHAWTSGRLAGTAMAQALQQ